MTETIRLRVKPSLIPINGTIAVGSVTTLAPGSPATVVNSGTPSASVFDFGLPAGEQGDPGLVQSIVAGSNVTINATDPANPIVSAASGIPAAGTDGQVLKKQSATDYDVDWEDDRGVISVLDYGAVGDNVTDDSAAFQAAFTAESDVFIPPGSYYLANVNLTITNKAFRLHGAGIGNSVLRWNGSSGGITVTQADADYHFTASDFEMLQDGAGVGTALSINGVGQRASGGTGLISDRTSPRFKIENIAVKGTTGASTNGWLKHIDLPSMMHGVIDGVHIVGYYSGSGENLVSESGIYLNQDTAAGGAELIIQNSWIFHTEVGIDVGEVEGVQISTTTIIGCLVGVFGGVTTGGNPHLAIVNNHMNCYVSSVDVRNRNQLVITGNLLYTRGDDYGVDPIVIRVRTDCDYSTISNNVLVENSNVTLTTTGIRLGEDGTVNETIISANVFQGFDVGVDDEVATTSTDLFINKYVSTVVQVTGTGTSTRRRLDGAANPLLMVDGSANLPGYSFQSDPDTGMFRLGANVLGLSVGGSELVRLDANGVGIGVSASPTARLEVRQSSASVNTMVYPIKVRRETTGTPSAGYGHGIQFEAETTPGNNEVGMHLETVVTDFTATSEDFDFVVALMAGGAAAAEAFRVRSSGALVTKGQIEFPATANPSSGANVLDDYEEGTFTPVLEGTTTAGAGTYSAQAGSYVKIGKSVSFLIEVVWSAHTGTGNMQFAGLPFTNAGVQSVCGIEVSNLTYAAQLFALIAASSTIVTPYTAATGGANTAVPMDTAATFRATGIYIAAT